MLAQTVVALFILLAMALPIAVVLGVLALFIDHTQDEESSFFPRAQQILGAKTTRDLRERYLTMQREVSHSVG